MKSKSLYRSNSIQNYKTKNKYCMSLKQKSSFSITKPNTSYMTISGYNDKVDMESNYQQNLRQIEESQEILEEKLSIIVSELNQKEVDIFNILKVNLEQFKEDLKKYEIMYNDTKIKSQEIEEQIADSKTMENILYNQTFMLREDCYACNNELMLLKDKAKQKIIQLKEIEVSHPKEYKFMQEEFQLDNELKNMTMKFNDNKSDIRRLIKEKKNDFLQRDTLLKKILMIESKSETIAKEIKRKNEQEKNINNLQKVIEENVIDILLWDILRELMIILYTNETNAGGEMNLIDIEKQLLTVKMILMKVKKEKMDNITLFESQLEETINQLKQKNTDSILCNETISILKENINQLTTDYTSLCIFLKQYEEVYNKYTLIFQGNTTLQKQNIHHLRKEIISFIIVKNSTETIDSFDKIISLYVHKTKKLNRTYSTIDIGKYQAKESAIQLNHEIDEINAGITSKEIEIDQKTTNNKQLMEDITGLNEVIKLRNMNLKGNLESLGEEQFNLYLNINCSILENMKKIYGKKVISKVFKTQKEKFYENVLNEHLHKKSLVNDSIEFIVKYDYYVSLYKNQIQELDNHYQELLMKYEACMNFYKMKRREKSLLDDSNIELKSRIENILKGNIDAIQLQRKKLQTQMNTDADLEHIKVLRKDIEKLMIAKRKVMKDYESFVKEYDNKEEQKKRYQTIDVSINNQKVSYSFVSNKSTKNSPKKLYNRKHLNENHKEHLILSIEDNINKSLNDFHKTTNTTKFILSKGNAKSSNSIFENTAYATNDVNDLSVSKSLSRLYLKSNVSHKPIDILKTLEKGMSLYVKFDNQTIISRINQFDPLKSDQYPPESCGYALRYFKLNPSSHSIEIRQSCSSLRYDRKILLESLHSIILPKKPKEAIILHPNPNDESNKFNTSTTTITSSYVPFTLVLSQSKLGLIAPNQLIFTQFRNAIMELISHKSHKQSTSFL